ncbi:uncharacterized protein LOC129961025 [Argiope bruennichi]|uniref:uncharacterized protein LOC129961025 n=1 Tax=Argiope bruennichi TaxID=94029 RepID=UPI002494D2D2|nr:uncharacterized protein LOC129961025 [Argiope bruennichi]
MFYLKEHAFQNFLESYRKDLLVYLDPLVALSDNETDIFELLSGSNFSHRLRFVICMGINFFKFDDNDNIKEQFFYFSSYCQRSLSNLDLGKNISEAFEKILSSIETFIKFGSGWIIDNIKFIDVHIGYYDPLNGGCFISLPKCLKLKKCILNINNCDDKCFLYCIIARLFPAKYNKNSPASYRKHLKYLNFSFLKFPVALNQIQMFEEKNNISINVYGFEKNIFPIYLTKRKLRKEVDLLLYKKHYFLITNFNRLLHEKNSCSFYCKNCLLSFRRKETLESHQMFCLLNKPQKLQMPSLNNNTLKFNSYQKMFKDPFCIYADFECLTTQIHTSLPRKDRSFSVRTQKHEPICYALFVIDENSKIVFHNYYRGTDCVENFLECLKYLETMILKFMEKNIPFTKSDSIQPKKCHLCQKDFKATDIIALNHCHYSGKFLGFAHSVPCNLNYKYSHLIPIVLHNFTNYDCPLIFKKISQRFGKKIKVIPINKEKFITFTIGNLKFLDSYHFLSSSLSKLTNNLKESNYDFPIFREYFYGIKHADLLLRKAIFPYDYFNNIEVLVEKKLPPKHYFYNNLNGEDISDEDYFHALNVWKKFRCYMFEDYLKLYLFVDCLLLADIFNNFRDITYRMYHLEALQFISAPDLTWSAGLKMTDAHLELLTDVDMYLMLERGIRGGICFIGKRYSKCNNPYVPETYNHNEPHKYIISVDVNNLYGFSMTANLPFSNFKWLNHEEIDKLDIMSITPDAETGYIMEVDLDYPKNLRDMHDDFPLAVEHLNISYENLSPYQKQALEKNNFKFNCKTKKLTPNLFNKRHYVTHYLNLQFYIKQGLKLKKVHRVMSFRQRDWLKSYVEFNTLKRKESKNEFDKSFFKLMINSFFGRSCMNVRKQIDVKIGVTKRECINQLSSSSLEYFSIINENCVLFKKRKINLFLNKPIYIGFTVLELSKLYMYKLYYEVFKENYGENVTLLYMDTDSFTLEIKCEDIYKDLENKLPPIFDFSNYDKSHELHNTFNENKLGFFKDETKGVPIKEVCSLKPKMYSYFFGDNCKRTAKGIKRSEVKKINHDMYVNVLKNMSNERCYQHQILSRNHEISTNVVNKKSLCSFYDKKFILENGVDCISYGHYSLSNDDRNC